MAVLARGSGHGYEVIAALRSGSEGAFDLPEGTVYPALHRLELAGHLSSEWAVRDGRRRRIYSITRAGRAELAAARRDWRTFSQGIESLLGAIPRTVIA